MSAVPPAVSPPATIDVTTLRDRFWRKSNCELCQSLPYATATMGRRCPWHRGYWAEENEAAWEDHEDRERRAA